MDAQELARRCRQERHKNGETQPDVAERLGVTKQAVSKAENYTPGDGMNRFRVKMLEDLTGQKVRGPIWQLEEA